MAQYSLERSPEDGVSERDGQSLPRVTTGKFKMPRFIVHSCASFATLYCIHSPRLARALYHQSIKNILTDVSDCWINCGCNAVDDNANNGNRNKDSDEKRVTRGVVEGHRKRPLGRGPLATHARRSLLTFSIQAKKNEARLPGLGGRRLGLTDSFDFFGEHVIASNNRLWGDFGQSS